ncbi:MAG TPA: UvrD-helicase domain-containing protein [Cyclobacteriaceae bacterium]|nr:UvrD-helicase domain-containing protein [Cyclobacteriaceae bacterium]
MAMNRDYQKKVSTEIINATEEEERAYLDKILHELDWAIEQADRAVREYSREFRRNQAYLFDQRSGMDEADEVSAGQSLTRMTQESGAGLATRRKLVKLSQTPYFGRIDFTPDSKPLRMPIYIGIHSFVGNTPGIYPIYDWRAPVSSMFYDFELGDAWYNTPGGTVKGTIRLRRQYRIRRGKMEFMIENDVNIQDDVLQLELSRTSDEKMKNIVATIQRDQNAIIRNETSTVMIIQGVAGSGKTSIAIHRIAFLLYRFRDEISSGDILIISPNRVFSDYISNVLPELGETQIPEMGMEELAHELLEHKFTFQTFLQQVFALMKDTGDLGERVRFKSSLEFVNQLNRYFVHLENHWLRPRDIQVGPVRVPASFIRERFDSLQRTPLLQRMPMLAEEVQAYVRAEVKRRPSGRERSRIHQGLNEAAGSQSLMELYRGFYQWLDREDLFTMKGNVLEYADVFPLIYCKIRLEGISMFQHVKHLVVDEMQDYTPVQYSVLARLFQGRKTILGDASQAINPYRSSTADDIRQIFPQADVVKLNRSYRSTFEITRFTQRIVTDPDLQIVERHGAEPEVKIFQRKEDEAAEIKALVATFRASGYRMMAIVCKKPSQARYLYDLLKATDVSLLTEDSDVFRDGIVVTTVPLAKGLEFDEVIVPFATRENYGNEGDRRLLYIACTRAMHKLTVTLTGERSPWLPRNNE